MAEDEEEQEESDQPLDLDAALCQLGDLFLGGGLVLHEFHHPDEPEIRRVLLGGLDDVVDARESGELAEWVERGVGDEVKGEDGDDVDEEPSLEVATGDFSAATDESLDLVVVGGEEGEHDVSQEDDIDEDFNQLPLDLACVEEAHLERRENRRHHDHTITRLHSYLIRKTFHFIFQGSSGRMRHFFWYCFISLSRVASYF